MRLYDGLCEGSPGEFIAALRQQQGSLRYLAYEAAETHSTRSSTTLSCKELNEAPVFEKLHTVHLSGPRCSALEELIQGSAIIDSAPLKSLWLSLSTAEWLELYPEPCLWIKSFVSAIPTLREFHLVFLYSWSSGQPSPDGKRSVDAVKTWLDERGVVLFFHERQNRYSFIPPYLYGEISLSNDLLYASDGRGWVERPAMTETPAWVGGEGVILDNVNFDTLRNSPVPAETFDANFSWASSDTEEEQGVFPV